MSTLLEQGCDLFALQRYDAAEEKFRAAFKQNPTNPMTLYNMGRVLEEKHNPHAEDFYLIAFALGSNDAAYQLGVWYEFRGEPVDALHYFRIFLESPEANNDPFLPYARDAVKRLSPKAPQPVVSFPKPVLVWRKP